MRWSRVFRGAEHNVLSVVRLSYVGSGAGECREDDHKTLKICEADRVVREYERDAQGWYAEAAAAIEV